MGNDERATVTSNYNAAKYHEMYLKVARQEEQIADIQASLQKMENVIGDNEKFKLQLRGAGWLLASVLTLGAAAASIGRAIEGWFK